MPDGGVKAPRTMSATPDSVDARLAEGRETADALFGAGRLDPVHELWSRPTDWLREKLGLSLGLNYTMLHQYASRTRGNNRGMFGDLDLVGRWELFDFEERWPASVGFQFEWRHRTASLTPGQLGPRAGSQWVTAVSANTQRPAIVELYWEQGRFEDGLIARIGKIDSALIYDSGRFVSQNVAFLSGPFSDSPPTSFPDAGLGAVAVAFPNDWLYVGGGVHDANAKRTESGFNSIDHGDFYFSGQLGITPFHGTEREGLYHVTAWRSEKASRRGKPSGQGFHLHAEQQLGPNGHFVPFARYARSSGGITGSRQSVAAGFGIEQPFGQRNDLFGFGFAWGEPKRSRDRDQYSLETFYRVRVTPLVSVTPDVQVIFDSSTNRNYDTVWVFSLRARAAF